MDLRNMSKLIQSLPQYRWARRQLACMPSPEPQLQSGAAPAECEAGCGGDYCWSGY